MAYFNELPFIQYPLRFEDQSSNQDFTVVRNIFRRAKVNEKIANYATAFQYYYIKDDERPDQIAERFYNDPQLDWVILIVNNILNLPSQWPLSNDLFYNYLIDKYGSEDAFGEVNYLKTNEVRDEYNRLVQPQDLKIDSDFYEEFTTIKNKDNPLYYDLNFYPVSSEDYNLKTTTNLGEYLEVWERENLNDEVYKGQTYNVSEVYLKKPENPDVYQIGDKLYPPYTRLDYSYLFVYGRNDTIKPIFNPITLEGWPYTWGGKLWVYDRENKRNEIELKSNVDVTVDITDDFRLYSISKFDKINKITYTDGTTLDTESGKTYVVSNTTSSYDGVNASFEVKRNNTGVIISVKVLDGGRKYIESEVITILGSQIGGVNGIDDIQVTVKSLTPKPQFRFVSIGSPLNEPYPGVKITSFNKTGFEYLNTASNVIEVYGNQHSVTNYDYEEKINEDTRRILLLKPEFLGAFIGEFRDIMSYDKSSETINNRIKKVYNPKIIGQ